MKYCVSIVLLAATLNSITFAEDASTLVANAQSLKLEYFKFTPNSTVSFWDVEFSGEEIQSMEWLLKRATPREDKGGVLFISAFDGEFSTAKQSFKIKIGEGKAADRPVLFILTEKNKPKSRQVYELVNEDARKFTEHLHKAFEAKTRNIKPDRVQRR